MWASAPCRYSSSSIEALSRYVCRPSGAYFERPPSPSSHPSGGVAEESFAYCMAEFNTQEAASSSGILCTSPARIRRSSLLASRSSSSCSRKITTGSGRSSYSARRRPFSGVIRKPRLPVYPPPHLKHRPKNGSLSKPCVTRQRGGLTAAIFLQIVGFCQRARQDSNLQPAD